MLVERALPASPFERVPPRGGTAREVTVLHPALAARYTALVSALASPIEAGLSRSVAANRVAIASIDPPTLVLRPFREERLAFGRRLAGLARRTPCLLFADVRDCYRSIETDAVSSSLRALGCDQASAGSIVTFLDALQDRGLGGLPIGPDPSAVLANAVLAEVDRALERVGVPHLRWVDDLVVGVEGSRLATTVLDVAREALARVGLHLNDAKTRLIVDPVPNALPREISGARSGKEVG